LSWHWVNWHWVNWHWVNWRPGRWTAGRSGRTRWQPRRSGSPPHRQPQHRPGWAGGTDQL